MNINKIETTEHLECNADTKLFFDDVYKSGTRTKKAQVETVQYGRSMIEMLGVLAIVGVLSVGGIAGYSKAMEKFKINKTIDEVSHIVANIRTLFAQQKTYGWFDTPDVIKMGIVPSSLKQTNSWPYLTNSFNGDVGITSQYLYDSASTTVGFGILYGGLSKSACIALASYNWGDIDSTGLIGMAVGSGYISFTSGSFVNGDRTAIREKGCYTDSYSDMGQTQVTCIGQTIPLTSSSSACNCRGDTCGVFWLYQ